MPDVLKGKVIFPALSTAITPPFPPSSYNLSWMTLLAACSRPKFVNYIIADISYATTPRMKYSPYPVDETAHVLLFA